MELTNEELELLFEAVTAWEAEPVRVGMLDLLVSTMIAKTAEERDAITERSIAEQEKAKNARERKAILLKARLVMAIEANATAELFNGNGG